MFSYSKDNKRANNKSVTQSSSQSAQNLERQMKTKEYSKSIMTSLPKTTLEAVDEDDEKKLLSTKKQFGLPYKDKLRKGQRLYQKIESDFEQQKFQEEKERMQKLREHKLKYSIVSFKNLHEKRKGLSYDEKLKQRQRMMKGTQAFYEENYLKDLRDIK